MKELFSLYLAFFRIGILTFGGGYAMLPMIEREIVVKYKWATMEEVMNYFAIGQCTPGVIAVNTATFIGYKRKGVAGGIIATLGVITPSIIIISLIASILNRFWDNAYVMRAFAGIAVAVCALLTQSVFKLAKSGIKDVFGSIVAIAAFVIAGILKWSPIIVVVGAGAAGAAYMTVRRKRISEEGDTK